MAPPRAPLGRIAIVYDCVYPFVPGGGQKRLHEIGRRLVAKGWAVDWYGQKSWTGPDRIERDGISYVATGSAFELYRSDGRRSIRQALTYGLAVWKFPQLRSYDVVHLGQWPYFHFFPVALYTLGAHVTVSVDWWEIWREHWTSVYGLKGFLGRILEWVCARIPRQVVAISEAGARQLDEIGVPQERISIIHNGIDLRAIVDAALVGSGSDLIYLGRLQPHKNVDLLVDALGLLDAGGEAPSLIIVGDGPERAALEAKVEALGLAPRVTFAGSPPDEVVYGLLRNAKVFVHPSTKEGGGSITSLEANAAGLPVVAFRHPNGISPELIRDGENGYWVERVEAAALAETIRQALAVPDREAVRRTCMVFAKDYDWDVIALSYHRRFLAWRVPLRRGPPC